MTRALMVVGCAVWRLVLAAALPAQQVRVGVGSIAGKVRDSTERPLPWATMTLDVLEWPRADRPQLRAQREVRVDSVGRFQIDSVPVGRHAVRILAFDYERQIDTLEVVANQVTLLDAVMAPAAFFQDPMDRERLRSATWQPQLQFTASTLGLRACPEAPLEARLRART